MKGWLTSWQVWLIAWITSCIGAIISLVSSVASAQYGISVLAALALGFWFAMLTLRFKTLSDENQQLKSGLDWTSEKLREVVRANKVLAGDESIYSQREDYNFAVLNSCKECSRLVVPRHSLTGKCETCDNRK
jgi:hypothetical protein